MFKKYLIDELEKNAQFIEDADIAKFIIQSYTGPFHLLKQMPNSKIIEKKILKQYKLTCQQNREKEIFQNISDNVMRLHIVPFIKKYRSPSLIADMFVDNFNYIQNFSMELLPIENIRQDLISLGIISHDNIISIIEKFNNEHFVPSHSLLYRNNIHPCYLIVVNQVIKDFIKVL